MPEYRRAFRPGGTFFLTVVTNQRRPIFADAANVERLRAAVRAVRAEWPFDVVAAVVLPDHAHYVWTLPPDDSDYPKRIGRMKVRFTRSLAGTAWRGLARPDAVAASRKGHRESGVWQRRFWEHVVRDETDLERHLNYLHFNPVKHRLCACPHAWDASSFQRWVDRGVYTIDWCCSCAGGGTVTVPYPVGLDATVGE